MPRRLNPRAVPMRAPGRLGPRLGALSGSGPGPRRNNPQRPPTTFSSRVRRYAKPVGVAGGMAALVAGLTWFFWPRRPTVKPKPPIIHEGPVEPGPISRTPISPVDTTTRRNHERTPIEKPPKPTPPKIRSRIEVDLENYTSQREWRPNKKFYPFLDEQLTLEGIKKAMSDKLDINFEDQRYATNPSWKKGEGDLNGFLSTAPKGSLLRLSRPLPGPTNEREYMWLAKGEGDTYYFWFKTPSGAAGGEEGNILPYFLRSTGSEIVEIQSANAN